MNVTLEIWVDYTIENLTLLSNVTFVRPYQPILFNMTVSQMSRANTTLTYLDGSSDHEYRYEMLEGASSPCTHPSVSLLV